MSISPPKFLNFLDNRDTKRLLQDWFENSMQSQIDGATGHDNFLAVKSDAERTRQAGSMNRKKAAPKQDVLIARSN